MAYDETLADRIHRAVGPRKDVTEKKMFGGVAFLVDDKMFCGVVKSDLMARAGPERCEAALAEKQVRPMDFTGRPMEGYVFVEPPRCKTDEAVAAWVERSLALVRKLPARKKPKTKKKAAAR